MTAKEIASRFESYIEVKKFNSARKVIEDNLGAISDKAAELYLKYNLGILYWSQIGDGMKARHYLKDVAQADENEWSAMKNECAQLKNNAMENMMILSTSYDEYFFWAQKLKEVNPAAGILIGQYPHIEKLRDTGNPWYEASSAVIALSYYNRTDPKADKGMYGCAASIYQIFLSNRKEMRIQKDYLETFFFEYLALMYKVVSQALQLAESKGMEPDPEDYLFIVDQVFGYVEQYSEIITFNDAMNNFIESFKVWKHQLNEVKTANMRSSQPSCHEVTRCPRCGSFNAADEVRCVYCALPLDQTRPGSGYNISTRCPHCGFLNSVNDDICVHCAFPINRGAKTVRRGCLIIVVSLVVIAIGIIGGFLKWWQ